jgi:integrase
VFTTSQGTPIHARNLVRAFTTARKKAGLEDVRFHDLRHTFATRLVQAGVDLYRVQRLLGHKTPTMTQRYAHHSPESLRDGVRVLEQQRRGGVSQMYHSGDNKPEASRGSC